MSGIRWVSWNAWARECKPSTCMFLPTVTSPHSRILNKQIKGRTDELLWPTCAVLSPSYHSGIFTTKVAMPVIYRQRHIRADRVLQVCSKNTELIVWVILHRFYLKLIITVNLSWSYGQAPGVLQIKIHTDMDAHNMTGNNVEHVTSYEWHPAGSCPSPANHLKKNWCRCSCPHHVQS